MIVFFSALDYPKNMPQLNAIFARGINGEFSLGDGSLPWKKIPKLAEDAQKDMAHFKSSTTGHIVIMGFNTFKTFTKPLPSRINIVIDRNCCNPCLNPAAVKKDDFNFFNSVEAVLNFFSAEELYEFKDKKIFLTGGAKLLESALKKNLINGKIYETVFNFSFPDAKTFFKPLPENFKILSQKKLGENSVLLCKSL